MALPNRKGWLAILFILFCLAIPFGITYYVSTQGFKNRYQDWQKRNLAAGVPSVSRVAQDKVVLMRDDRVKIANTALVFTGLEAEYVCLDLYLLELDAGYPYRQKFPLARKNKPIRLGDVSYTLASVNKRVLVMNISDVIQTD